MYRIIYSIPGNGQKIRQKKKKDASIVKNRKKTLKYTRYYVKLVS